MPNSSPSDIVLFDGSCTLCNGTVKFIIRNDPAGRFRFAPLQSVFGRRMAESHGYNADVLESVLLVERDHVYSHSTAALRIARRLKWPWPVLSAALIVPRLLRDAIYRWIAGNRYRWFGKQDACMMPTPPLRARFLTGDEEDLSEA